MGGKYVKFYARNKVRLRFAATCERISHRKRRFPNEFDKELYRNKDTPYYI